MSNFKYEMNNIKGTFTSMQIDGTMMNYKCKSHRKDLRRTKQIKEA